MKKKSETSKTPESAKSGEVEGIATGVRENIEELEALKKFDESDMGMSLMEAWELNSITDALKDENVLIEIIGEIVEQKKEIDPIQYKAFISQVAQKFPHLLPPEAIDDNPDNTTGTFEEYPDLPEEVVSPERRLLTLPGQKLPKEVLAIMGKFETFQEAMNDERAFGRLIKDIAENPQGILPDDPDLFSEMLVIAAEADWSVNEFLRFYKATCWNQIANCPKAFEFFMREGWFTQMAKSLEPAALLHELIIVAINASKENARLVLDKAAKKEMYPLMEEGEPNTLEAFLGEEAFKKIMAAAEQMYNGAK